MNPIAFTTRFIGPRAELSKNTGKDQRGYTWSYILPAQHLRTSLISTSLARSFSQPPILYLPKITASKPLHMPAQSRVFTPLEVDSFSRKQKYSSDDNQTKNERDWSQKAESVGRGLYYGGAGIAAVLSLLISGYQLLKSNQKDKSVEKEKKMHEEKLRLLEESGLVNFRPLKIRTPEEQANEYREAKRTLMVVGVKGSRLLSDEIDDEPNPVRKTIEDLVADRKKVRLVLYSKDLLHSKNPKEEDERALMANLEVAQCLQEKYPYFEFRVIDEVPPFQGDLVDHTKAHIVPNSIEGFYRTQTRKIETYVRTPNGRLNDLISDFEYIWKEKARPYVKA